MGGKSRKGSGPSKALIDRLVEGSGKRDPKKKNNCGTPKQPKTKGLLDDELPVHENGGESRD